MDRSRVSESWIGHRVILFPLDEQGDSGRALHRWLRDVQDDGVLFAKGFHSDTFKKLMPENPEFYPWHRSRQLRAHFKTPIRVSEAEGPEPKRRNHCGKTVCFPCTLLGCTRF